MRSRWRNALLAAMVAAILAAAAPPPDDPSPSPYLVVLVDGTTLRAKGPPRVAGDETWIVHAATGVAFAVPTARVDLEVSRRLNRMIAARTIPSPPVPAVSGGREAGSPPPLPEPAAPARVEAAPEDGRDLAWSRRLAALEGERNRLDEERSSLEARRREIEEEIRRYLGYPTMVSALGKDLKEVRAAREENARRREEVASRLADLRQVAAERGIPLRQLP